MNDFIFFFKLGWSHIISIEALDHLYFIGVLAVIYSFNKWKQVLVLVTAFTIGHSLTLILSVLDVIRFNTEYVEFAIPCTIVFSAGMNMIANKEKSGASSIQYILALLFGLVHGMGYANAIRFMLFSGKGLGMALFGFNLGLESGQIFVVLLILFFVLVTQKYKICTHRKLVMLFSALILVLSLKMAVERLPFLS
jgi:hypothetical protein